MFASGEDEWDQNGNTRVSVNLSIIFNTLIFMAMNSYICSLICVKVNSERAQNMCLNVKVIKTR